MSSFRLFPVVNLRSQFHNSLALGNDIPLNLRDATWVKDAEESVAGCVLPTFFPVYFGQDIVYGDTRTAAVTEAFAQLGKGYEVWLSQASHAIRKI